MDNLDIFRIFKPFSIVGLVLSLSIPAIGVEGIIFEDEIQPILQEKCFKCHGEEKQKGELRLDSADFVRAGGENGSILFPGDPHESPLYFLTTYPEDDPDYMPQKGGGLTQEEKQLLLSWIQQGARFADGEEVMVASADSIEAQIIADDLAFPGDYLIKGQALEVISSLEDEGMLIDTVNHDASRFEVKYTYAKIEAGEFDFAKLKGIEEKIQKIDLSRTKVSDTDLVGLSLFKNLRSLNLSRTSISDQGLLALKDLRNLEYLNLHDTSISDAGLEHVAQLSNLRQLYVWNTDVTRKGIAALSSKRPELRIENGDTAFSSPSRGRLVNR